MASTAIQAPWVTFVANTTTSTIAVQSAPVRFTAWARRIRAGPTPESAARSRDQCRTMPVWLSVKLVNTPMM